MGTIQNLFDRKALEKLQQLVKETPTCMFGSNLAAVPFHVCPMEVQQVDENGSFWLFSGADSVHNAQIRQDPRVHLIFGNPSKHEYLTVYGQAEISRDPRKVDELWSNMVKTGVPQGQDDPNLTLIRISPERVHYWDVKDGKLAAMAKIMLGAVTGKPMDVGVEGDLTP